MQIATGMDPDGPQLLIAALTAAEIDAILEGQPVLATHTAPDGRQGQLLIFTAEDAEEMAARMTAAGIQVEVGATPGTLQ